MAPPPQSRGPVLAGLAVLAATGLLAAAVLMRSPASAPAPSAAPAARAVAREWPERRDDPRALDPSMISADPSRSSYELAERPPEAAKDGQVREEPSGAGAAKPGDAAAAAGAAAPGLPPGLAGLAGMVGGAAGREPPELDAKEKGFLAGLVGGDLLDPKKAVALGESRDGLWTKVMKGVARHPKVMAFILNNDLVVKGFMSDPQNAKACRSPSAAQSYLTDVGRPGGVSHAMDVFETVLHGHPDMPRTVFGSKLADAIMSCPSTQSLSKDRAAVQDVAQRNPRAIQIMLDPSFMLGVAANPSAAGALGRVKTDVAQ